MPKMQVLDQAAQPGAYDYELRVALLKGTKHHYLETSGFVWGINDNPNEGGRKTTRVRLTPNGIKWVTTAFRMLRAADANEGLACAAQMEPHSSCAECFPFTAADIADAPDFAFDG